MITKLLFNQYACAYPSLSEFRTQLYNPSRTLLSLSNSSFKCFCSRDENALQVSTQRFSALNEEIPWDNGNLWSTLAFYMFSLHIPLSFGWMSLSSQILHQPDLDPHSRAISLLVAQVLELSATLILLKLTANREHRFEDFYKPNELSKERNWFFASAIGFGFLFVLVVTTSFVLDIILEPKAVNNPVVKEMLMDSNVSKASCVFIYCVTAPLLEETVYRGFLLRSLSSTMKWQKAVLISSAVFSAAHFSGENFLQLFIIGCVLGCSYCWTGNLSTSLAIHSLYNATTLIVTFLS